MRNIVFFDLDNTIVRGYTQKLFIKYLFEKKIISVFFLFKIYLWFILYKLKVVRNPKKIMGKSFFFINGWSFEKLDKILENFCKRDIFKKVNLKVKDKIKEHLKNRDEVYIISNVALPLVEKIANNLGIKNIYATELEIDNGHYTGRIKGNIMYGENKAKAAKNILSSNAYSMHSYCYADHYSDLPLFDVVDEKIAVCPSRDLEKIAKQNNWLIIN